MESQAAHAGTYVDETDIEWAVTLDHEALAKFRQRLQLLRLVTQPAAQHLEHGALIHVANIQAPPQ